MPDDELRPEEQLPDLRRAAGYLVKSLREGVEVDRLRGILDWVDRSFESDPLAQVRLSSVKGDGLVVARPHGEISQAEAQGLVEDLARALGGRACGVVLTDPNSTIEDLDDSDLERAQMARMPDTRTWEAWRWLISTINSESPSEAEIHRRSNVLADCLFDALRPKEAES
jgi:hypothetical protein